MPGVRRVEEHVLRLPRIRRERDDAAQPVAIEHDARLLAHLAQQTFLRALVRLEMAADAHPLVMVDIVRLLHAVHHEIRTVALEIAERREIRLLPAFHLPASYFSKSIICLPMSTVVITMKSGRT